MFLGHAFLYLYLLRFTVPLKVHTVKRYFNGTSIFNELGQLVFPRSVSLATFGAYMAAAVDHSHMVQYLDDLLTAGGKVSLVERLVSPDEIGKIPADLKPDVLLRLYRGGLMFPSCSWTKHAECRLATFRCCPRANKPGAMPTAHRLFVMRCCI
jgi:hypothetical protein